MQSQKQLLYKYIYDALNEEERIAHKWRSANAIVCNRSLLRFTYMHHADVDAHTHDSGSRIRYGHFYHYRRIRAIQYWKSRSGVLYHGISSGALGSPRKNFINGKIGSNSPVYFIIHVRTATTHNNQQQRLQWQSIGQYRQQRTYSDFRSLNFLFLYYTYRYRYSSVYV